MSPRAHIWYTGIPVGGIVSRAGEALGDQAGEVDYRAVQEVGYKMSFVIPGPQASPQPPFPIGSGHNDKKTSLGSHYFAYYSMGR